jgi:type I restriction enzyme S subunit
VKEGDVFFTRTSETIDEIGLSSTCFKTIKNAVFAGFLIRFRPHENLLFNGFSRYYFRSLIPRIHFVKEMNLVTRASLSQELLKSLPVCLPGLKEQKEIATYLDSKVGQIDSSIDLIEKTIEKISEYRKSIIYEAVTGKIDIRKWEPNKKQMA